MSYEHRDVLISKILSNPPFQLPPIVHAAGCFTLDVTFRESPLHVVAISLDEALTRYWEFVSKVNYSNSSRVFHPLDELPVKLGTLK